MRISGYGEFQQVRKLAQRDDAQLKENAEKAEKAESEAAAADSVLISPETRRKAKLRQASDFRQEKVDDVKSRLEAGSLVTPETLASGARKMLDSLYGGYL
ncbi:MAG: flagellar biosynthesis anti-sigma factor FlgM [Planctomycetota bacterium]|jgi:anti-sigma28 factor (negative regulator of flagellin synthesis)|nr:flagellar biosynthesis anti-sigma factor FlgM [Planctomycetota bacterium]